MLNLTVGDTRLGLRDMLTSRYDELLLSATGKLYAPRLLAKREALEALPDGAQSRSPFAEELGAEDVTHDGIGAAVFYLSEAILAHPFLSQEMKRLAAETQGTYIPQLQRLRQPYADEAATALANRPKLTTQKQALKTVQVPGGGTLFDWVKGFIDAGDKIDGLLRKRAHTLATAEDASRTAPLRGATLGLLTRFREALRDEVADPGLKLPADYEGKLFSYLDKLASDRAAAAARRAAGDAPVEPPANGAPAPASALPSAVDPAAPAPG